MKSPNNDGGIYISQLSTTHVANHVHLGVLPENENNVTAVGRAHARVVVSGNAGSGIVCLALSVTIGHAYIGVGADGVSPVPNQENGLELNAQTLTQQNRLRVGPGAVISGNHRSGIVISAISHYAGNIVVDGCLIGLVDESEMAAKDGVQSASTVALPRQVYAVGNLERGVTLPPRLTGAHPVTIKNTLIGGNLLEGIFPANSQSAQRLDASSRNYPKTTPLLGNDRANQVCQRCMCTRMKGNANNANAGANEGASASANTESWVSTSPWLIDCSTLSTNGKSIFEGLVPIGFGAGADVHHANTSGPLTTLRMVNAGLTSLPWSSELSKTITSNLNVLDFSDNSELDPLPPSLDGQGQGHGSKFVGSAFPSLASLFLQGTDLSSFSNDTLSDLANTLSAIDFSRPSKPPAANVVFNFTGFHRLSVVVWYNNSKCPHGFFATSNAVSREDIGICARCPIGTYQPEVGKFGLDACQVCPSGTTDADRDPTTACTKPSFRLAEDVDPKLTTDHGYLPSFTAGETYEFDGPASAKIDLFDGYAGDVAKIVYVRRYR